MWFSQDFENCEFSCDEMKIDFNVVDGDIFVEFSDLCARNDSREGLNDPTRVILIPSRCDQKSAELEACRPRDDFTNIT